MFLQRQQKQLMDENPDKKDTYLNQFIDIQCEIHAQYMPLLSLNVKHFFVIFTTVLFLFRFYLMFINLLSGGIYDKFLSI